MTTIAVNRNQIAGDQLVTHTNGIVFRTGTKLSSFDIPEYYPKPFTLGFCGDVDVAFHTLSFFTDPSKWKPGPRINDTEFIMLTADHKIYTFCNPTKLLAVKDKFYAVGSGSHFAMGAMQFGATPVQAVKAAIKQDPKSGRGVTFVNYK